MPPARGARPTAGSSWSFSSSSGSLPGAPIRRALRGGPARPGRPSSFPAASLRPGRPAGGPLEPEPAPTPAAEEPLGPAVPSVIDLAAPRAAPDPGPPSGGEPGDVEPVAGLRALPESGHGRPPARAVAGARAGDQVAQLVGERRQELAGMPVEQAGVELDRARPEVGAADRAAQPGVEDHREAGEPPAGAEPNGERAGQPGERGRRTSRGRSPWPRGAGRGQRQRQLLQASSGAQAPARSSTRASASRSTMPVVRKTTRPSRSTTTRVGRPRMRSCSLTWSSGSTSTG